MPEAFERGTGSLYQPDAAAEIEKRFGRKFIYRNYSGGTSIDMKVLKGVPAAHRTERRLAPPRTDLVAAARGQG
jgi:hypothetical protein